MLGSHPCIIKSSRYEINSKYHFLMHDIVVNPVRNSRKIVNITKSIVNLCMYLKRSSGVISVHFF